jgi:glutaminase
MRVPAYPKRRGVQERVTSYILTLTMEANTTAKINLVISDELETQFRNAVFKKYGMKRGNISKATEEALRDWIKKCA